jgi:hypothetical protein
MKGDYPELPKEQPLLFSSIFHALKHKDIDAKCTTMLIENWRMNEVLFFSPLLFITLYVFLFVLVVRIDFGLYSSSV